MLYIKDLIVSIDNQLILHNINLFVNKGEIHVILGKNGSSKSSLLNTIIGNEDYKINNGSITFCDVNINNIPMYQRSLMGIFLAFQNPVSIPNISVIDFIKEILKEHYAFNKIPQLSVVDFNKKLNEKVELLGYNKTLLYRSINENFSGGEKKMTELLQMLMIDPKLILLDEIDSGVDINTIKHICDVLKSFLNNDKACIIVTHNLSLFEYINPDYVHVIQNGKFIKTGNKNIIDNIKKNGL